MNANGDSTRSLFVYDPGTNLWTRRANIPQHECGGSLGVIGGKLYAYTGCYAEESSGVFFRYDPATDSWVRRAAPPPPDHKGGAGAVINGKFYLVSGTKVHHCFVNNQPAICDEGDKTLHVYDPTTNAWGHQGADARFQRRERRGPQWETVSPKRDSRIRGGDLVYDPGSNTWGQTAHLPQETAAGAAAAVAGKIVYVSGYDSQQPVIPGPSKVYVYTP